MYLHSKVFRRHSKSIIYFSDLCIQLINLQAKQLTIIKNHVKIKINIFEIDKLFV